MSGKNGQRKYSEDFKKTIVTLYESGKTYADIKKEYGISSSTLSGWVKKYSQVKIDDDTILTAQQIKALQKRNAELEEENLILKKSDCNIHATLRQRLKAIEILSKQHKISILCRVLNVNRSTYYKYINRKPSNREQENLIIRQKILELYAKTDKRLGVNKIKICLQNEYCLFVSTGRVYRLMKEMNLPKMSTVKPPKFKHNNTKNLTFQNKLTQNFNVPDTRSRVVCDFTYVKVGQRFGYICAIMDLYARKVIAYKISNHINTDLAIKTLQSAVKSRKISNGILFILTGVLNLH